MVAAAALATSATAAEIRVLIAGAVESGLRAFAQLVKSVSGDDHVARGEWGPRRIADGDGDRPRSLREADIAVASAPDRYESDVSANQP